MADDAPLTWRDGVPVSTRFDDPYYSLSGGLEEARHVYLGGNDLPARLCDGFHVGELGFGTGLNLAALLMAADGRFRLRYTTFEAFPMAVTDMRRALEQMGGAQVLEGLLAALETGATVFEDAHLHFTLIKGDARKTLPTWSGRADAWFLDGFSPAKNPEMWSADLMAEVARHTHVGGTAATFTAARSVRDGLEGAGFEVTRAPGFGRKKHMTQAVLPARYSAASEIS